MTYYIKVRPYVAKKLKVEAVRKRYADGNYLIWDKELRMVDPGWVFHIEETVARIGGLLMDPYRNKEEQQKTAEECTPLPWPTDPAWVDPEITREEEMLARLEMEAEKEIEKEIEREAEEVAIVAEEIGSLEDLLSPEDKPAEAEDEDDNTEEGGEE